MSSETKPAVPSETARGLLKRLAGHVVVRNAALMYGVQITSYIFPLLALPYLTKVLSRENFGLVSYAQTFIWYFLTLTEYGFNLTATRSVAVARDQPEQVNRIFSEVMVAKALLTVIGFALLCITVLATPALRVNFSLYAITFLSVIGNLLFPLWLYQGLQKMEHVALRDFLAKLFALGALFVFVHRDADYLRAAAAQSGALLLAGMAGLWTVRKLDVTFRMPSWEGVKGQLRAGWPAYLSLAVSAGAGITDTFIMGLRTSASEVAYYSAAQRVIAALRSLVGPISTAVYPHASQKAGQSELDVIIFVRKYAWLFAAPFLAAGILLFVVAPWVIPVYLGKRYVPSVIVLQVMAFIPALFSLTQSYSTHYMLACGYDKPWMRIMLTTVAVNFIVLVPSLIFLRGSVAVALTGLVVEGTGTLLYYLFYRRRSRELRAAAGGR